MASKNSVSLTPISDMIVYFGVEGDGATLDCFGLLLVLHWEQIGVLVEVGSAWPCLLPLWDAFLPWQLLPEPTADHAILKLCPLGKVLDHLQTERVGAALRIGHGEQKWCLCPYSPEISTAHHWLPLREGLLFSELH